MIGLAWSLITFLTIPILVLEDVGVVDAFKRSGVLFKKTWGENVAGQAGLGIVGFVVALPGIALIAIGAALGTVGLVLLGGIGVIWLVVSATVVGALSGIYRTALYRFASSGEISPDFAGTDFQAAFEPRRGAAASAANRRGPARIVRRSEPWPCGPGPPRPSGN